MSKSRVYPLPQYTASATPIEVVIHTPPCTSTRYTSSRKIRNSFYKRVEAIAESKFAINIKEYVGDVLTTVFDEDSTILPNTISDLSNQELNKVSALPPKFTDELSLAELGLSGPPCAPSVKSYVTPDPSPVKKTAFEFV